MQYKDQFVFIYWNIFYSTHFKIAHKNIKIVTLDNYNELFMLLEI